MVVETEEDKAKFQLMLNNLAEWSADWQMLFNADKCHVIHTGKKNPAFVYDWGGEQLEATEEEKDVGVIISKSLKPSLQCARAAKKANLARWLGQFPTETSTPSQSSTRFMSVHTCSTVYLLGLPSLLEIRNYWRMCNAELSK